MRRAAKRDTVEPAIVDVLRLGGASILRLSMKDAPDLLVGGWGVNELAEAKTDKNPLSDGQQQFKTTWRGSPVWILRSIDDALALLKHMQKAVMSEAEKARIVDVLNKRYGCTVPIGVVETAILHGFTSWELLAKEAGQA